MHTFGPATKRGTRRLIRHLIMAARAERMIAGPRARSGTKPFHAPPPYRNHSWDLTPICDGNTHLHLRRATRHLCSHHLHHCLPPHPRHPSELWFIITTPSARAAGAVPLARAAARPSPASRSISSSRPTDRPSPLHPPIKTMRAATAASAAAAAALAEVTAAAGCDGST